MTYLFKLWTSLSNIGVQTKMPFYIKRRINITNRFSWILIGICFSLIIVFFNDPHFKINSLVALGILGILILFSNFLQFTGLSRFLLSVCPSILLLISSIIVKLQGTQNIGLEHYLSIQYVIGATIVLPFTLFHWREKIAMFSSVFLVLILAFFFNQIHAWFDVSMQNLEVNVTSQAIINTNLYITFALLFLSLLFLLSMNHRYSKDSEKLLEAVKTKNQQAQERENNLQNTLEKLRLSKEQEEQQSWVTKGLADFEKYFRKQNNLEALTKQIISALVKYIGVEQGAIYIVKEDENTSIELISCYAFDEYFYEKKKFVENESLVGQVYAQKKKIYLNNIPDDYLAISSGLGKISPKHLLIVPVLNEDVVEGIIEVASLKSIDKYKIEFIERLCENLASAMLNIKINLLSEKLLTESQKKDELLKLKEEELKTALSQLISLREELEEIKKLKV